ncbi:tRNA uridine-5-carboxymethylaminomethyl(34) synthesis GTPase MnmE [Chelatococcus sambhunathii]|uniref:tRNA modification GTPase MnmE n=1 Tax=Chelatococcus sambhunathii TaxID=363953 RepID=A0ABU1DFK6_9HYPH|nr:tRNA uridine-5-carboxymethylaminomethyl(34) synthesis GTPase MnmE [Chelatococcus sambhunathii]MDR4306897.1 tRNA uridine-5-carboxymethylaminomethyl(34) synthesis GTPase MnmE [Chelatococcus sambhunathii]
MSGPGRSLQNLATDGDGFKPRDTIAAVSTAPGKAAIAVIRISGPAACACLTTIAGAVPEPRRAVFRAFRNPRDGSLLDRGLALWFPGPASATGEDLAELHVHGGRAVTAAVLDAALSVAGVRLAEPGEFTRRAFVAGRMDLAEAEGLADLLAAETEAQRRQALLQSEGALSAVVERWRERLVAAMALIEAGIDFSDEEDVTHAARAEARREVEALAGDIAGAIADRRAERMREGFQVAILGRPNAGKSSLLNALAQREVAIVTEAAGTTRDVLEVHLDLDGIPVTVADTAGLRDASDLAEQEGVRRAEARAAAADLVLWLDDAASPAEPPPLEAVRIWRIANKIDLADATGAVDHRISVRTGEGLATLVATLAEAGREALGAGEDVGLTRARHRDAARAVHDQLAGALAGWDATPDELLAEQLRAAATELGRITGRIGVEDVLGAIFSSFCIGK